MMNLKTGDTFIDCVSGEECVFNERELSAKTTKLVHKTTRNGSLVFGYTRQKSPYFIKVVYLDRNDKLHDAVSSEIFPEENLKWDHRGAYYLYSKDKRHPLLIEPSRMAVNRGCYRNPQDYSANSSLSTVSSISVPHKKVFSSELTSLIPYTIGVEFETSNGTIPPDECYRAGLIPLRDGSISGLEYATIILDPSKDGFERLKYCTKLLDKYTESDKECSLHMHFGGFPLKLSYLYTVYRICKRLEPELKDLLPKYAFKTSAFKRSEKDYCNLLPVYTSINKFYEGFSGGEPYLGSLMQSHSLDLDGRQKWHLNMRYFYINFINAMFYKKNKTLEFRFMAPTTSFSKITCWVYLLSAILKYAEIVNKNSGDTEVSKIPTEISFRRIIETVYPENISVKLFDFLNDLIKLKKEQEKLGDSCGCLTALDGNFFKGNIL